MDLKIKIGLTLACKERHQHSGVVLCCVWRGKFYFGTELSRLAWVRDGAGEDTRSQTTKGLNAS